MRACEVTGPCFEPYVLDIVPDEVVSLEREASGIIELVVEGARGNVHFRHALIHVEEEKINSVLSVRVAIDYEPEARPADRHARNGADLQKEFFEFVRVDVTAERKFIDEIPARALRPMTGILRRHLNFESHSQSPLYLERTASTTLRSSGDAKL